MLTEEHSNGKKITAHWNCCSQKDVTDEFGIVTTFSPPNGINRIDYKIVTGPKGSITTNYTYDGVGNVLTEATTATNASLNTTSVYDGAGHLKSRRTPDGLVTQWGYGAGGRTVTVTHPGGATEITDHFIDGRVKSVTGTAVIPRTFQYSIVTNGWQQTVVQVGGGGSAVIHRSVTDLMGHLREEHQPGFLGVEETTFYDYQNNRLQKVRRPGLADSRLRIRSRSRDADRRGAGRQSRWPGHARVHGPRQRAGHPLRCAGRGTVAPDDDERL